MLDDAVPVGVQQSDEGDELLTVAEVAKVLRLPPKKVYALPIARVELTPRRFRWLRRDLRAYINSQRRIA